MRRRVQSAERESRVTEGAGKNNAQLVIGGVTRGGTARTVGCVQALYFSAPLPSRDRLALRTRLRARLKNAKITLVWQAKRNTVLFTRYERGAGKARVASRIPKVEPEDWEKIFAILHNILQ